MAKKQPNAAELRHEVVLRNQRECGVGGRGDHWLLGLEPFAHKGLELCIGCHLFDLSFCVEASTDTHLAFRYAY